MLSAQVEYWKLQENARHNLTTEAQGWKSIEETQRHNVTTETLGFAELNEKVRHNYVTEDQNWFGLKETQRHNFVTEQENARHNVATEQENVRSHQANERLGWAELSEESRHHGQQEAIDWQNVYTMERNSAANVMNAQTRQRELSIAQQQADTAQYRAETERTLGSERNAYDYLGYTNDAYRSDLEASRNEWQEQQGWAQIAERMYGDTLHFLGGIFGGD